MHAMRPYPYLPHVPAHPYPYLVHVPAHPYPYLVHVPAHPYPHPAYAPTYLYLDAPCHKETMLVLVLNLDNSYVFCCNKGVWHTS